MVRIGTRLWHPRFPEGNPLLSSRRFLDWLQPGVHADLIGGKVFMHSPVSLRHAGLTNFLERLLALYIEEFDLGALHRETVAVRLGARDTFLPDLSYFTKDQAALLGPTCASFAPTLVVEVVSPATARRDRGDKFSAYERHGVEEYWILDPDRLDHRFHRRAGDRLVEHAVGADRIEASSLPGFWVRRSWLDPKELPRVRDCLAEILRPSRPRRVQPPRQGRASGPQLPP